MLLSTYVPEPSQLILPANVYGSGTFTIYPDHLLAVRDISLYTWAFTLGADHGTFTASPPHINDSWSVTAVNGATLIVSNGKISATSTMRVATSPTASGKKIVLVGDSLTEDGRYADTLASLLPSWTFLGLKTSPYGGTKNEGHSGKTALWFHTDPSSPFVNGGVLDIPNYITQIGDTPNIVYIMLGINDMINTTLLNMSVYIGLFFGHLDALIAAWEAAGATVYLGIEPPGNAREDAFWNDYGRIGGTITRWRWKQVHAYMVYQMMITYASRLIPCHLGIDLAGGYAVLSGVHPQASGYTQVGTQIYNALAYIYQT